MENLVKDFLSQKTFAVAGSFRNESKYAYRILRKLKEKGYGVYPVNPRFKEIDGLSCYSSVRDIPASVDVANIVTPPQVTTRIVRECKDKGITKVWFQPGAQSKEAIIFCRENNIEVIHGLCVMLEAI